MNKLQFQRCFAFNLNDLEVVINNRPNKQISTIEVLAKKKLCLKYVVKEKDIEYLL